MLTNPIAAAGASGRAAAAALKTYANGIPAARPTTALATTTSATGRAASSTAGPGGAGDEAARE